MVAGLTAGENAGLSMVESSNKKLEDTLITLKNEPDISASKLLEGSVLASRFVNNGAVGTNLTMKIGEFIRTIVSKTGQG